MIQEKHFPSEYKKEDLISLLNDLTLKLKNEMRAEGEKVEIERKIMVCQNQLVFLSLIESNNKLQAQQELLVAQLNTLVRQHETLAKLFTENIKTDKRTAKEAKFIIIIAIITFLFTSIIEYVHMVEEKEKLSNIEKQLDGINKTISKSFSSENTYFPKIGNNNFNKSKYGISK